MNAIIKKQQTSTEIFDLIQSKVIEKFMIQEAANDFRECFGPLAVSMDEDSEALAKEILNLQNKYKDLTGEKIIVKSKFKYFILDSLSNHAAASLDSFLDDSGMNKPTINDFRLIDFESDNFKRFFFGDHAAEVQKFITEKITFKTN